VIDSESTARRTSFPQKPFPLTSSRIGLFNKVRTVESTVKEVTAFFLRETKGITAAIPFQFMIDRGDNQMCHFGILLTAAVSDMNDVSLLER
jgi:hypothetical protein